MYAHAIILAGVQSLFYIESWSRCVATLLQVIQILDENPNIILDENYTGGDTDKIEEPEEGTQVTLWGNVAAFVERLDDELFKSLQVILY